MPVLQSQDLLNDPIVFPATANSLETLSYTTTELTGGDSYKFSLFCDFEIRSLTAHF